MTQNQVRWGMYNYLKNKYKTIEHTKDYIYCVGDIPIALVAHMDTVHKTPVVDMFYDQQKNVVWSPQGLGADDRAGIFAIMAIVKTGLRPHIILTTDEETGGVGACSLAMEENPFPELKYMIELDRRGTNDCVFYDVYNEKFIEYIESFGFVENYGSFSDICMLSPEWKVVSVNLSVGYHNEHTLCEYLHVGSLMATIQKVVKMLMVSEIPDFEYIEMPPYYSGYNTDGKYAALWANSALLKSVGTTATASSKAHCSCCFTPMSEYELFPVKGVNKETIYMCPDCIVDHADWCPVCGEAFEIKHANISGLCPDCEEKFGGEVQKVAAKA